MIIIYPYDPSTKFLKGIVSKLHPFLTKDIDRAMPDTYGHTISFIESSPSSTLLFLGHGFSDGLYGGCYVTDGRQILVSRETALRLFKGRKIILLCCRSSEFLLGMNETFLVGIGFGNIKTSKEDLTTKADKLKYGDLKVIHLFRDSLVTLFTNSIVEASEKNFSFYQFYNGLKLRINKMICGFSLSKNPVENLVGELMFELKREMIIKGDVDAFLISKSTAVAI